LAADGALFTNMFGEEHCSQGNYFWLFSGSDQRVGFEDDVPKKKLSNLGQPLIARGLSLKGYAEDLPALGSEDVRRRLTPASRCHGSASRTCRTETPSSSNLRFEDFPSDFSKLPTESFVVPTCSMTCIAANQAVSSRQATFGCVITSGTVVDGRRITTAS
jgi:hypothetical protein